MEKTALELKWEAQGAVHKLKQEAALKRQQEAALKRQQEAAKKAAERNNARLQLELAERKEREETPAKAQVERQSILERLPRNHEAWKTYLQAKYSGPDYRWPAEKWRWNFENDARDGKGETDPRKAKNPLLAPFMAGGATETQFECLLERCMGSEYRAADITPYMRAGLTFAEAKDLCEWGTGMGGDNLPWNTPCRVQPQADWWNWIFAVRKAAGLPEFTSDDKIRNRWTRLNKWIQDEPMPLAIPVTKYSRSELR